MISTRAISMYFTILVKFGISAHSNVDYCAFRENRLSEGCHFLYRNTWNYIGVYRTNICYFKSKERLGKVLFCYGGKGSCQRACLSENCTKGKVKACNGVEVQLHSFLNFVHEAGHPSQSAHSREETNPLLLPGIEQRSFGHSIRSPVTIPTEVSRLRKIYCWKNPSQRSYN